MQSDPNCGTESPNYVVRSPPMRQRGEKGEEGRGGEGRGTEKEGGGKKERERGKIVAIAAATTAVITSGS